MKEHETRKQQQSFYGSLIVLKDILVSANKLVPGVVFVAMLLTAGIIAVSILSSKLMIGVVILLVLFAALLIYMKTRDYGQAALALVAGLLTAFTVEWTVAKFVAFVVIWIGFSLLVMIIASIRLAAQLESIYVNAASWISSDPDAIKRFTKQLQDIGSKGTPYHQLHAVARAEAIRLLAFRKIPLESLSDALASVEIFFTMTGIDVKDATLFIADVSTLAQIQTPEQAQKLVNEVLNLIRESAVPPVDFIKAFQLSRSLVLSKTLQPEVYFSKVREALEAGFAPEEVRQALSQKK